MACGPRVLVVDDHEVLRDGLVTLFEDDGIDVVGVAGSGEDALTLAEQLNPDLVVLDHRLPDADGVETAGRLHASMPDVRILMFTGTDDRRVIAGAAAAGCSGFVVKNARSAEVLAALHAVADGGTFGLSVEGDAPSALTSRERDALELAAAGLDNQAIAQRLYMSVNTVRNHFQHILIKLDAHSKLEAVAVAVRLGLIRGHSYGS